MVENISNQKYSIRNTEMQNQNNPVLPENQNCFDENDWTTSAANAVKETFNDESFFTLFQEQAKKFTSWPNNYTMGHDTRKKLRKDKPWHLTSDKLADC